MILTPADALLCLALNVYFEARGETIPGQYAVALVTRNRADGDKRKVCREVFKPQQFSWANKGVKQVGKRRWKLDARLVPKDAEAWKLAQRVANVTLVGRMSDFTMGSTHYHAKRVNPYWNAQMIPTRKIDSHVFYKVEYKS